MVYNTLVHYFFCINITDETDYRENAEYNIIGMQI